MSTEHFETFLRIDDIINELPEFIEKKIGKKAILKEIAEFNNSIVQKNSLVNTFSYVKNKKKRGSPIEISSRYKNLIYTFISLRLKSDTFDVVTRSDYDEIERKKAKNRNSTSKNPETMSKKEMGEIVGFINQLIHCYNQYFTQEERETFKKYFDRQGTEILSNYEAIYDFERELLFFIIVFFENYSIYDNQLLKKLNLKFKEINEIMIGIKQSSETENNKPIIYYFDTDLWNIYDATYDAFAKSIDSLYNKTEEIEELEELECKVEIEDLPDDELFFDTLDDSGIEYLCFYNSSIRMLELKKQYYLSLYYSEITLDTNWMTEYTEKCMIAYSMFKNNAFSFTASAYNLFLNNVDMEIEQNLKKYIEKNLDIQTADNNLTRIIDEKHSELITTIRKNEIKSLKTNEFCNSYKEECLKKQSLSEIHEIINKFIQFAK